MKISLEILRKRPHADGDFKYSVCRVCLDLPLTRGCTESVPSVCPSAFICKAAREVLKAMQMGCNLFKNK